MAVEKKMYTSDQMCNMVDFLADNIFVKFGRCIFHQVIGIAIGTSCVLHFSLTCSFTHMKVNF